MKINQYRKSERSCSLPGKTGRGLGRGFIVLLLLLFAVAPAMAQNVAFTGETTTLGIEPGGDNYKWELFIVDKPNFNFATEVDNCPDGAAYIDEVDTNKPSVKVKWLKAGVYFFKVTVGDASGCSTNFKIGVLEVKAGVTAVITPPLEDVCVGKSVALEINFTGSAPWKFDYSAKVTNDDGTTTTTIHPWPESEPGIMNKTTMFEILPAPTKTTEYTIVKVSDYYGTSTEPSNKVTQVIYPLPDPSDIYHR